MPDIASLKLLGLAGVMSYAAARLAAKAGLIGYSRCLLIAAPLSKMPDMPSGFRVESLTLEELANHQIDVPFAVQKARFDQGMSCLAAFNRRNEFVGVTWIGAGPYSEDMIHVRFVVPPDSAWDTGLWIVPRHRLGRGFAALWAGMAEWLRTHNRQSSMSWIADYNLPSIMSHRRMGAKTLGHILILRLVRWQYMAKGKPRFVRLSGPPTVCEIADCSSGVHKSYGVIATG